MMLRGGQDIANVYGGNAGMGDIGFSVGGFVKKAARKTVSVGKDVSGYNAAKYLVKSTPGVANNFFTATRSLATGAGKILGQAAVLPASLTIGAGRSILGSAATSLKNAFTGGPSKPGVTANGGGGTLVPSPETQAAAAAAGGYSTSPAAGYGGGGGGGGDVAPSTSSALTADTSGQAGAPAPETLMEKFMALSTLTKVALVGGVAGAGYFGYKKFVKRRGGRRSKS